MRWFVVQSADFIPQHVLPAPPENADFVSQADFCGHGLVEGRKQIYIFRADCFKNKSGIEVLRNINEREHDFVIFVPQQALTGLNLIELSGTFFSNAAAVIEYRAIGGAAFFTNVHQNPSSEHFEQLSADFRIIFIPVDRIFTDRIATKMRYTNVLEGTADVMLACDRERGIAWGTIRNIELY